MTKRVLIIGGYGNFGRFISSRLLNEEGVKLIIAGRSIGKAKEWAGEIGAEAAALDINNDLASALANIKPDIVIHTSGPFQIQEPHVAKVCIDQACHYIDLADGRAFVEKITTLNQAAKDKGVLVLAGASSVPGLTSALVDHYLPKFKQIETLDYGITTAQKTNRGLATTAAILSYTGKPFQTFIDGKMTKVFGWQNLHIRNYPDIGLRLLGNCDVPDLSLFPKRYPSLKTIRFYAGQEIHILHLGLWCLSWLVRFGLVKSLDKFASQLLSTSFLFDKFGSDVSAFHMQLGGLAADGKPKTATFDLVASSGDGPNIPCIPPILLTKQIARGGLSITGAFPCMGFITLEEYLDALDDLDIRWTFH